MTRDRNPASETPAPKLLDISTTRNLVEIGFMAAEGFTKDISDPLCALLDLVSRRLQAASASLEQYRASVDAAPSA